MLYAKNASSLSHADDVKGQLGSLWTTTPKIKNSFVAHLVMVGYISLSRSACPGVRPMVHRRETDAQRTCYVTPHNLVVFIRC